MAKNQTRQSSLEAATHVLERGDIYFAYRPKVEVQVAKRFEDVQRLHVISAPVASAHTGSSSSADQKFVEDRTYKTTI